MQFAHEKHGAYQAAVRYVRLANEIAGSLPRGHGEAGRDLRNAARSLICYVAQGVAALGGPNLRFLARAHTLAIRSVALVTSCSSLDVVDESTMTNCRTLLGDVVQEVEKLVAAEGQGAASSGASPSREAPVDSHGPIAQSAESARDGSATGATNLVSAGSRKKGGPRRSSTGSRARKGAPPPREVVKSTRAHAKRKAPSVAAVT